MNRLAGSSLSGYFAVCQHRAIQGYQSSLLSTWLSGIWLKFPGITYAVDFSCTKNLTQTCARLALAILFMHFSLVFQKPGWSFWFKVCRFSSKTTILFAHCTASGRGQQLFPTQDEGEEIVSKIRPVVMETRTRIFEAKMDAFINQRWGKCHPFIKIH